MPRGMQLWNKGITQFGIYRIHVHYFKECTHSSIIVTLMPSNVVTIRQKYVWIYLSNDIQEGIKGSHNTGEVYFMTSWSYEVIIQQQKSHTTIKTYDSTHCTHIYIVNIDNAHNVQRTSGI